MARLGPAYGGAHARIPLHPQTGGEIPCANFAQESDGGFTQIIYCIAIYDFLLLRGRIRWDCRGFKTKFELIKPRSPSECAWHWCAE